MTATYSTKSGAVRAARNALTAEGINTPLSMVHFNVTQRDSDSGSPWTWTKIVYDYTRPEEGHTKEEEPVTAKTKTEYTTKEGKPFKGTRGKLLAYLQEHPGQQPVAKLAAAAGIDPGAVSGALAVVARDGGAVFTKEGRGTEATFGLEA